MSDEWGRPDDAGQGKGDRVTPAAPLLHRIPRARASGMWLAVLTVNLITGSYHFRILGNGRLSDH